MAAYKRQGKGKYHGRDSGADDSAFLFKGLETQVTTFTIDSDAQAEAQTHITDVKPVASYSWIEPEDSTLTIAVPGSPRIWTEECGPVTKIPRDSDVQFVHYDATKMGDHSPLLPLFAAIDALHDDFPYKDLDLVTDRNGLRKLMRFVNNVRSKGTFCIDVDLVQNTCVFTRREEKPWKSSGYGHEYLRAATKAPLGLEKMVDHQRVITYKLGSLNILLSGTIDACTEPNAVDDEHSLASVSSVSIQRAGGSTTNQTFAGLNLKLTSPASLVPQSSLIEVKTRSASSGLDWKETYPQIYLAQIGSLYVAKHTDGTFGPVEKIPLEGERMKAQAQTRRMGGSFDKLRALLEDILRAVREQGEGVPLTLVCQGPGKLALWKRKKGSGKPLEKEIMSKFKA